MTKKRIDELRIYAQTGHEFGFDKGASPLDECLDEIEQLQEENEELKYELLEERENNG